MPSHRSNRPQDRPKIALRLTAFSAIAVILLSLSAAGTNAAGFSFIDSIRDILGIPTTETSVLKTTPVETDLAKMKETNSGSLTADIRPEVATTVSYTGMTLASCPGTPTATISPSVPGLTFSQITRGSGVTCGTLTTGITGSGFNTTLAAAITGSKWYTFSITSDASTTFTVDGLSILSQVSNASGTPNVSVQYSIGGSSPTTVIGSYTPAVAGATYPITPGSLISVGASQTINIYVIPNSLNAGTTTCRITNASSISVTTTSVVTAPTSLTYSTNPATYTNGVAITNNTPSNGGGAPTLYGITPALPTGLNFSTSTGVISGTPSIASVATNYTVTASNGGGSTNATVNITVNKANQTITFGALGDKTFGDADFSVSATASSGLTVSFGSQTTGICTVTGTSVHIVTAGTCTIRASQAGNTNYNAAPDVDRSFSVNPATPTVTFGAAPTPTYLGGDFTVSASTTNSDSSTLTYSVVSGPCAHVSGATFSSSGAGTCVVKAEGAATTNFILASAQQNVTIAKAEQSALTVNDPGTVVFGSTPQLATSGGSGAGAVTFDHGGSTGCTVTTGGVLTVTDATGTCAVTATKAADTNYNSAASAAHTITLAKAEQATLVAVATPPVVAYGTTSALSTTGGSGAGAETFSSELIHRMLGHRHHTFRDECERQLRGNRHQSGGQ